MVSESLAPGWLPDGIRVYAIGDPHGCAARLGDLHRQIAEDFAARPIPRALILHLGDYVDRGPDSAGVIEMLRGGAPVEGMAVLNLIGNHEQMMLAALDPSATHDVVDFWMSNGGREALESYGAWPEDRASWNRVPAAHIAFLRDLHPSLLLGGYFFTHAGIRPEVPLDQQDVMDLTWIREPFLSWRGQLPAVVVHGHTPAIGPEVLPHRIGIDTGAVFGGPLTAVVLEGTRIGFLFA